MAYFSKQNKASKQPAIKKLLKEYNIKGSLSVYHHSTVRLTIQESAYDFIGNYLGVMGNRSLQQPANERLALRVQQEQTITHLSINPYWYHEHFSGVYLEFLTKAMEILMAGNHNNSDIQSDYFDVGWYVDICFGRWDKPYRCTDPNSHTNAVKEGLVA